MKTFRELKREAREALRGNWVAAVFTAFLAALLGGGSAFLFVPTDYEKVEGVTVNPVTGEQVTAIQAFVEEYLPVIIAVAVAVFVVALVYSFLVSNVLRVGYARFNMELIEGRHLMVSTLFEGFHNWWPAVKAMGLMALEVTIKLFMFVVPGIAAAFDYAAVPYVMAQEPRLKARDALKISKYMMRGYRWRAFLLELSYIGWALLVALVSVAVYYLLGLMGLSFLAVPVMVLGGLGLSSYMEATMAAFYLSLSRPEGDAEIKDPEHIRRLKFGVKVASILFYSFLVLLLVWSFVLLPNGRYGRAVELMEAEEYVEAITIFEELGGFRDSREMISKCLDPLFVRSSIAAGTSHAVVLRKDGTVATVGSDYYAQCRVSDWKDIVSLAAGGNFTAGLRADGTVLIAGPSQTLRKEIALWSGIVSISVGDSYVAGLRYDGTIMIAGWYQSYERVMRTWKDVVALGEGGASAVGLLSDGTVEALGDNDYGECNVYEWRDIVSVAAGGSHTVGLRSDGTVMAVGSNDKGQCSVTKWQDVVAITAGENHTVGLCSDGTLVAAGWKQSERKTISWQKNIVAIASGKDFVLCLRSDGTLVAIGDNSSGQCNVSGITDIRMPE